MSNYLCEWSSCVSVSSSLPSSPAWLEQYYFWQLPKRQVGWYETYCICMCVHMCVDLSVCRCVCVGGGIKDNKQTKIEIRVQYDTCLSVLLRPKICDLIDNLWMSPLHGYILKSQKGFLSEKQVHVGPSKTNQTGREWHHITFTPSVHLVPFCQHVR